MATDTTHPSTTSPRCELARPEDDAALRRLLRESPMQGEIRVTLEREPSCFEAARIEGTRCDFLVHRDSPGGAIHGFGSRAIYDAWVNGAPRTLGYLGQLRVGSSPTQVLRRLRDGYRLLEHLDGHDEPERKRRVPFYVTTIVADNARARRLLERGLTGLPAYRPLGRLTTMLLPVRRTRRRHWDGEIASGPVPFATHRAAIAACLHRNGARFQCARRWNRDEVCGPGTPGLEPADFFFALRHGSVVGCLAVWDQRAFKQVVVRGYAARLARVRPWFNLLAPFLRVPRLPSVGAQVDLAAISHLAIDEDDPDCFGALLDAASERARDRGLGLIALGLTQGHPLLAVAQRSLPHHPYESIVYAVHWPDAKTGVSRLDGRPLHLEVATL